MRVRCFCAVVLTFLLCSPAGAWAQVPVPQAGTTRPGPAPAVQPLQLPPLAEPLRPNYMLGPGDVIQIRAPEEAEIVDRTFRIENNGEITLPIIGSIRVAGLTVDQVQTELNNRLRVYYVNPQATVTLVQFRSDPVFFLGAFNAPGIYALQGRRTLVEMLTLVGGLAPSASRHIHLTRQKEMGSIPLPNAVEDASGKGMTVDIALNALTRDINPPEDILLMPYDLISAEKAELVYLSGAVVKPGGYELGEKETVSTLQIMSMAGGVTPEGVPQNARILRPISNVGRRAEIPIDLKQVLSGETQDINLMPGDVLYVPRNSRKATMRSIATIAIPAATAILVGIIVYKR